MQLITILLSLIVSNVMAQDGNTDATDFDSIKEEQQKFVNDAVQEMKKWFSYQGNGTNQEGLIWANVCKKPWNATYGIACVTDSAHKSGWKFRVAHHNFQGPKIRIGPSGEMNACAKINGTLHILRIRGVIKSLKKEYLLSRIEDITREVDNFNGDEKFDGKGTIFWDKYKMDRSCTMV